MGRFVSSIARSGNPSQVVSRRQSRWSERQQGATQVFQPSWVGAPCGRQEGGLGPERVVIQLQHHLGARQPHAPR